ncbi:MAG TPA: cell wall hydrolase [Allosphingosinicella sp.]
MNAAIPSPASTSPNFGFGALLIALLAVPILISPTPQPNIAATKKARSEAAPIPPAARRQLLEATLGEPSLLRTEGDAAKLINATLPFSHAPVEAANPFSLSAEASDEERALRCLTQAVYFEAGFEPIEGRRAVAQVVLNRVRHPAFPKSVCGVVYQGSALPGCQFSFTCDGSLRREPAAGAWAQAQRIAREALAGAVSASVGQATHFHTDYVAPFWAPRLSKIRQIGAHIFYRWPGSWGRRGAFTGRYAGGESVPSEPAIPATAWAAQDGAPAVPDFPPERRAEDDVGGRLDVTREWRLAIPDPAELGSALAAVADRQAAAPAAPAEAISEKPSGGS